MVLKKLSCTLSIIIDDKGSFTRFEQKGMIIIDKHMSDYEQIFNEIEKLPLRLNAEDYYLFLKRGYDYLVMLHDSGMMEHFQRNFAFITVRKRSRASAGLILF